MRSFVINVPELEADRLAPSNNENKCLTQVEVSVLLNYITPSMYTIPSKITYRVQVLEISEL
jgi:hypothetical protein